VIAEEYHVVEGRTAGAGAAGIHIDRPAVVAVVAAEHEIYKRGIALPAFTAAITLQAGAMVSGAEAIPGGDDEAVQHRVGAHGGCAAHAHHVVTVGAVRLPVELRDAILLGSCRCR